MSGRLGFERKKCNTNERICIQVQYTSSQRDTVFYICMACRAKHIAHFFTVFTLTMIQIELDANDE